MTPTQTKLAIEELNDARHKIKRVYQTPGLPPACSDLMLESTRAVSHAIGYLDGLEASRLALAGKQSAPSAAPSALTTFEIHLQDALASLRSAARSADRDHPSTSVASSIVNITIAALEKAVCETKESNSAPSGSSARSV